MQSKILIDIRSIYSSLYERLGRNTEVMLIVHAYSLFSITKDHTYLTLIILKKTE